MIKTLVLLLLLPTAVASCALPWGLGVVEPRVECDAEGCSVSAEVRPVAGPSGPAPAPAAPDVR